MTRKSSGKLVDLFHNILNEESVTNTVEFMNSCRSQNEQPEQIRCLLAFLEKAPGYLQHFFLTIYEYETTDDLAETKIWRREFLKWICHTMLFFWTAKSDHASSLAFNCQKEILDVLQFKDPWTFSWLSKQYIDLIAESISASEMLYDNDNPSVQVTLNPFSKSVNNSKSLPISFDDPELLESFQVKLTFLAIKYVNGFTKYLPNETQVLFDLGLRQVELGEFELKIASLSLCRLVFNNTANSLSKKASLQFYDVLFSLVQQVILEINALTKEIISSLEDEIQITLEAILYFLRSCRKSSQKTFHSVLFSFEVMPFWTWLMETPDRFNRFCELSDSLKLSLAESLSYAFENGSAKSCFSTNFLSHHHSLLVHDPVNFEVFAGIVAAEVIESMNERMKKDHSVMEKPNLNKSLQKEYFIEVKDDSQTWRYLLSWMTEQMQSGENLCNEMGHLLDIALTTLDKLDKLNAMSHSVFLDFFPRDMVEAFLQEILRSLVIAKPHDSETYNTFTCKLFSLIQIQPLEKLTQNLLQQIIAIASLPWMADEIKIQDLRIGDKLKRELMAVSMKMLNVEGGNSFSLLCSIQKDVSPQWRSHVLRKAWFSGKTDIRISIIQELPMLVFTFLSNGNTIAKEILHEITQKGDMQELRALSEVSPLLICALSRNCKLTRSQGKFSLICQICSSTTVSPCEEELRIGFPDIENLLKLVGYSDPIVRKNIGNIIQPLSNHLGMTVESVHLWSNYFETLSSHDTSSQKILTQIKYFIAPASYLNHDKPLPQHVNIPGWQEQKEVCSTVLTFVKTLCEKVMGSKIEESINMTINTLNSIGLTGVSFVQEPVFDLLIDLLLCPSTQENVILLGSAFLKTTLVEYKTKLMHKISLRLCVCPCPNKDVIEPISMLFGYSNVKTFLSQQIHYLLPSLVLECARMQKSSSESSSPLHLISSLLEVKIRQLFVENFSNILPFFVVNTECTKEYDQACHFLESEMKIPLTALLPSNRQKLIVELMMFFHTHQARILVALNWFANNDDVQGVKRKKNSTKKLPKEELIKYILPKFLGVLGYFDKRLVNPVLSVSVKEQVLLSLKKIIEFLGQDGVATVKHKLMATFKAALSIRDGSLAELVATLWLTFVKTLDKASIGPIAAQVIASLYSVLEAGSQEVLKVYRYVIVENEIHLEGYFHQLSFMPMTPELSEFNDIILRRNQITPDTPFSDILYMIMNSLDINSPDVQIQTLQKLKEVLSLNQGKVQGLVLKSNQADTVICRLIDNLMKIIRDSDSKISLLASQCLGYIGAVDPGRLEHAEDLSGCLDVSITIDEEKFVVDLLRTLVDAFLKSSNSSDSDVCAYCIQEVLKCYKIKGRQSSTSFAKIVWSQCSDLEKEVMTPFLTSLYARIDTYVNYECPLFNVSSSIDYQDWISRWCTHLIKYIRNDNERNVFQACKAIASRNTSCAEFILPYIITSVLINGDSDIAKEILSEVNAVLDADINFSEAAPSSANSESIISNESEPSKSQVTHLTHKQAVHTIFAILDHLSKWLRKKYLDFESRARRTHEIPKLKSKDKAFEAVENFLNLVCQKKLAMASFNSNAYARALMHMEKYLLQCPEKLQGSLFFLQQIYCALSDSDFVKGIEKLRENESPLQERIFYYMATNNYQDALACYEGYRKEANFSLDLAKNVLESYLHMDQPHTAFVVAQGLKEFCQNSMSDTQVLREYRMEAAWQLSQWDSLQEDLQSSTSSNDQSWRVGLAALLSDVKNNNQTEFFKRLEKLHSRETHSLSTAAVEQGAYQRSYNHIVNLQCLNEIQKLSENFLFCSLREIPTKEVFEEVFASWQSRLTFIQYSLEYLEPVLKVRRCVLRMLSEKFDRRPDIRNLIKNEITKCVLNSAKAARKAGQFNKAFSLLVEADFKDEEAFIERAKLDWSRGLWNEAISTLQKGIEENFPWYSKELSPKEKNNVPKESVALCGKAKLILARYIDTSASLDAEAVPIYYKEAQALTSSEDVFYYAAKFYDKILGKNYKPEDLDKRGDIIQYVIRSYGRSLLCGCNNIHHSLARVLTLWFDYGARVVQPTGSNNSTMTAALEKINNSLQVFMDKFPTYYWLFVFPQLTSRICHTHKGVWQLLKKILIKVFIDYPQQAFWHIVSLSKSSNTLRKERCKEVLDGATAQRTSLAAFINDGMNLANSLQKLADKPTGKGSCSLEDLQPGMRAKIRHKSFSHIILPTTKNMTVVLPSKEFSLTDHNALPPAAPHIIDVMESVTVMPSLIAPKKITFLASDGNKYSFLCKPKDDLRRDCRLIDFNDMLNNLFKRDPECRKRDLRIRTYKVIPLNETSGIIEWVNNLLPLRTIITKLYRQKFGISATLPRDELERYKAIPGEVERNNKIFEILVKRHPLVLAEWFTTNFPDPQTWYLARLAFIRSTAVMSMVGYLIGLGDRHSDNILIDASNGDTVHVDLNCIFNKGETLNVPEIVPFRLTRNMVHAMGPNGVEGPFRIACEKSLGLMRDQKDLLMTTLRPFVYDPLVDWLKELRDNADDRTRSSSSSSNTRKLEAEVENKQGLETLNAIKKRLDGLITRRKKGMGSISRSSGLNKVELPLSVAGQVKYLIEEATSEENLAQMFIGWSAYL